MVKFFADFLRSSHLVWQDSPVVNSDREQLETYASMCKYEVSNVLTNEEFDRNVSQLLCSKPTSVVACYKFRFVVLKETNVTVAAGMIDLVSEYSTKLYRKLMVRLIEKCIEMTKIGFTKGDDILIPESSYRLNPYDALLYPKFSCSAVSKDEETKDVEFNVQLSFEMIFKKSILNSIKLSQRQTFGVFKKAVAALTGVLILNTMLGETFVIQHVHLDKNAYHRVSQGTNEEEITIAKYWQDRFQKDYKLFIHMEQPLIECVPLTKMGKQGSSVLLLPQFCFPYGPSKFLSSDPKFLDALKEGCKFSFQRSEGYLRDFIAKISNCEKVHNELKVWGFTLEMEHGTQNCDRRINLMI